MSEDPKFSKVTRVGNQYARVTDQAPEDFHIREWIFLGDELLANITDHEGAYIVLDIAETATIPGHATMLVSSSTSGTPVATSAVVRNSSNNQSSTN